MVGRCGGGGGGGDDAKGERKQRRACALNGLNALNYVTLIKLS